VSDFKAPSGANISIRIAPFDDAMALKDAIGSKLAESGVNLKDAFQGKDLKKEEVSDFIGDLIDPLVNSLLSLDSSKELRIAIFKCLNRCTCEGERITGNTFEPPDRRGDYYPVVIECLKVNLLPFFQNLSSQLDTLQKIIKKDPKSK